MSENESQLTNEVIHVIQSDQKAKEFAWVVTKGQERRSNRIWLEKVMGEKWSRFLFISYLRHRRSFDKFRKLWKVFSEGKVKGVMGVFNHGNLAET